MPDTKDKLIVNNELDHLIKLLDDEDENIYSNIRERFLSHGDNSFSFLKNYLNDENLLIKKRANEIISILKFEDVENKFKSFALKNSDNMLEEAVFLLASFGYPGINIPVYKEKIDQMAADIELQLLKINADINLVPSLEALNIINNYMFFDKEFKGNSDNYYDSDNSFINKVIDTKRGIPVTLSILYILICRRLGLPVFGVNLPGHFILKYCGSDEEFFIDPFNKGVVISLKEAAKFVKKTGLTETDLEKIPYLKKSSDKEMVLRVMRNLVEIYNEKKEVANAERIEKLMLCLT